MADYTARSPLRPCNPTPAISPWPPYPAPMRHSDCDETKAPATDPDHIDAVLCGLDPEELPGALRLLNAMERAGWIDPEDEAEWRGRILDSGTFHEDTRFLIDGSEDWPWHDRAIARRQFELVSRIPHSCRYAHSVAARTWAGFSLA